jgi:hypothetical protein
MYNSNVTGCSDDAGFFGKNTSNLIMIMKCRIAIKALFLYFNVCLSVMLDSL